MLGVGVFVEPKFFGKNADKNIERIETQTFSEGGDQAMAHIPTTSKAFDFTQLTYKEMEFLIRLVDEDAPIEGRINLVRYSDHVVYLAGGRWCSLTTFDVMKFFCQRHSTSK